MSDEKPYRLRFSRAELLRLIACLNAVADSFPGLGTHPERDAIRELSKSIEEAMNRP